MYNQSYKLSSSKARVHHSQDLQVKKSNSTKLTQRRPFPSKFIFDKQDKRTEGNTYLKEMKEQVPLLRITNRRSSSFDKKSKILLKPITSRRQEHALPELLGLNKSSRQEVKGQGDVEELFYQQVRILQQFKKLAELVE